MRSEPAASTARPSSLSAILDDLRTAGIRPTPLGILSRATDLGLSDAMISEIVNELANERGLDQVPA